MVTLGFPSMLAPPTGCTIKMDDDWYPYFRKPPILWLGNHPWNYYEMLTAASRSKENRDLANTGLWKLGPFTRLRQISTPCLESRHWIPCCWRLDYISIYKRIHVGQNAFKSIEPNLGWGESSAFFHRLTRSPVLPKVSCWANKNLCSCIVLRTQVSKIFQDELELPSWSLWNPQSPDISRSTESMRAVISCDFQKAAIHFGFQLFQPGSFSCVFFFTGPFLDPNVPPCIPSTILKQMEIQIQIFLALRFSFARSSIFSCFYICFSRFCWTFRIRFADLASRCEDDIDPMCTEPWSWPSEAKENGEISIIDNR